MSAASARPCETPPVAGGAVPAGQRLLGLVQRLMGTGMAMARHINRIARQRLEGQPLSRLGPPGFSPTAVNALVVQAVAWTAVLRERLLAVIQPSFAHAAAPSGAPRPAAGRSAASFLPDELPNPTEEDCRHNWWELAKPLRLGPTGVAAAAQLTAALGNQAMVTGVCDMLGRATTQLGAAADTAFIAGVETTARALCAELEARMQAAAVRAEAAREAPQAAPAEAAADPPAEGGRAPVAGAAEPVADETAHAADDAADHAPPPKPPDG